MAYVIAEPCVDHMDQSCVQVCPVDAISSEAGVDRKMFIDPQGCIECGAAWACAPTARSSPRPRCRSIGSTTSGSTPPGIATVKWHGTSSPRFSRRVFALLQERRDVGQRDDRRSPRLHRVDGPPRHGPRRSARAISSQVSTFARYPAGEKLVQRPYSVVSLDEPTNRLELFIRRVPDGELTSLLWVLGVGVRVRIGPAKGLFVLDPEIGDAAVHRHGNRPGAAAGDARHGLSRADLTSHGAHPRRRVSGRGRVPEPVAAWQDAGLRCTTCPAFRVRTIRATKAGRG